MGKKTVKLLLDELKQAHQELGNQDAVVTEQQEKISTQQREIIKLKQAEKEATRAWDVESKHHNKSIEQYGKLSAELDKAKQEISRLRLERLKEGPQRKYHSTGKEWWDTNGLKLLSNEDIEGWPRRTEVSDGIAVDLAIDPETKALVVIAVRDARPDETTNTTEYNLKTYGFCTKLGTPENRQQTHYIHEWLVQSVKLQENMVQDQHIGEINLAAINQLLPSFHYDDKLIFQNATYTVTGFEYSQEKRTCTVGVVFRCYNDTKEN